MPITPSIMDFAVTVKDNSIHNTPPTFIIYVMGRVFEWIKRKDGVTGMHKAALIKSQMIYNIIDNSTGFYSCPINVKSRSRMNVPFRIMKNGKPDDELEKEFLKGAEALNMVQLKGHRSVGGIRASLYNAVKIEEAKVLATYMTEFQSKHQK